MKDYSFKDIEKYLKKDKDVGEDILNAFENLSDAAIIFSPIILGPQFLVMLELLDVKDKLCALGRKVCNFIAQKKEKDYVNRTEQMKAAYALICYTSYFDILQDSLSKDIRKKLKGKFDKKVEIMVDSMGISDNSKESSAPSNIYGSIFYTNHIASFSEMKEQLLEVYKQVTENIIRMMIKESIFNSEKEKQEFESLKTILEKIPQRAIKVYESQYLTLADHFNDFALFAQLKNFEGIHSAVGRNRDAIEKLMEATERIDVGLKNLNGIVNAITTDYSAIQAQDIVNDLKQKYIAMIEEPIIDDKEIKSNSETLCLKFPKIVDAFIPQSYKCLSYEHKETKLEDTSIWDKLPVQSDLDKFFVKYLYSPDSIDYPLVVLGQPGSGKSLLTKVLSAQLMSTSYTVIRIPLREVNAEAGIDVLVEDQIKKLTSRSLLPQGGYGSFAAQFNEKPLIIILDGYDELLQAKGEVFSGYLEKVRIFQQDQKSMKRPVRIIITSRITLIDKARIPINSTILRLMEFNVSQKEAWIDIWNRTNANYFAKSKITPFQLPTSTKEGNSILELAEQPLLLLMLALYDSEANELAKTSDMRRTDLYDNLLRRFVRRERRRYVPDFEDKSIAEQEKIIDNEMERLGVVAIGMYNREEVVILSDQLEKDLDIFKAHRRDNSPSLYTLKESESVLGGFFFIHKSTAQDSDVHSDNSESAYEFLHNTFGEFLTADFILRNTINEVCDILVDRKYKPASLANRLSNPDSLSSNWFYCLMFVPLYSRPVVIEMLREHMAKALKWAFQVRNFSIEITPEEFIDNLKFLIKNQLEMVLNTRNLPNVMRGEYNFNHEISLLGYLSTYTLNLVLLACTLSPMGFEFNEEEYCPSKISVPETRPWDKLTSLWKMWFAPTDLMGLSVILKTKRKTATSVLIECNKKFGATRYEQPIDILLCVSSTLSDSLLTGLSGLQTDRFREITQMNHQEISKMLKKESPDLYFSHLLTLLRNEINGFSSDRRITKNYNVNYKKVNKMIHDIICDKKIETINRQTLLSIFEILEYCLKRKIVFLSVRKEIVGVLPRLINISRFDIGKRNRCSTPEIRSAAHLLPLLIENELFSGLNEYREVFMRYRLLGDKWSTSLDETMHLLSSYIRNHIYFYGEDEENHIFKSFETTEKLSLLSRSDDGKRILKFLSSDDLEILLKTDPGLLCKILLNLWENSEIEKNELLKIMNRFLTIYLEQLESVGVEFIKFETIINSIKIANYVRKRTFLTRMMRILNYYLYGRHLRLKRFLSLSYLYPNFVADLIDVLPEIFTMIRFDTMGLPFSEREYRYIREEKMMDYIKLVR